MNERKREGQERCEQMMQVGYERKRWWERQIRKQEMQDESGSVRGEMRTRDAKK